METPARPRGRPRKVLPITHVSVPHQRAGAWYVRVTYLDGKEGLRKLRARTERQAFRESGEMPRAMAAPEAPLPAAPAAVEARPDAPQTFGELAERVREGDGLAEAHEDAAEAALEPGAAQVVAVEPRQAQRILVAAEGREARGDRRGHVPPDARHHGRIQVAVGVREGPGPRPEPALEGVAGARHLVFALGSGAVAQVRVVHAVGLDRPARGRQGLDAVPVEHGQARDAGRLPSQATTACSLNGRCW